MKKILYGLLLATLLSIVILVNVRQLEASGTIYIRPSGQVEGTDKIIRNGDIYTFTSDIKDSIVVEKSHIVIDGAGHVLEGMATGMGINLIGVENVTIRNTAIKTFEYGIFLRWSSFCTISGNSITMSFTDGIYLVGTNNRILGNNISLSRFMGVRMTWEQWDHVVFESSENIIDGNNITANNLNGIDLSWRTFKNDVTGNNVKDNKENGIYIYESANNNVLRNNVMNNFHGLYCADDSNNIVSGNNFTANNVGIVLERSSNDTLSGNYIALNLEGGIAAGGSNNILSGNNITANNYGIYFGGCLNSNASGNRITDNRFGGIVLDSSCTNTVSRNDLTNNNCGIWLTSVMNVSSYNDISSNTVVNHGLGIRLGRLDADFYDITNNGIYHNSFLNNTIHAEIKGSHSYLNTWDEGPSGGNYWSDYEGTGTEPYVIDPNNIDHYPLRVPEGMFPVFWKQAAFDFLITGSNITVARFDGINANKGIGFKAIGQGYVNLTIPREYSDGFFKVFINDIQIPCMSTCDNTSTSIYFESRTSGSNNVKIVAQMKFLGDIDGNGAVNIIDISIVAKHFGQKLGP